MHSIPTFLPTADESMVAAALQKSEHEPVILLPNGHKQTIPVSLAGVLAMAAQAMMNGCAVSLTIHRGYLTTKQAADMLACSRQHVVKLIDEGKLCAEKVPGGTHRRIRLRDLLEFMRAEDICRDQIMDEMAALTDEIGGYDELYQWKRQRNAK